VGLDRSSRFQVPGNVPILYHQGMFRGSRVVAAGNDAASPARRISSGLEADGRTEGYAKIVARAVVEVDLIAHFKAKADGTNKAFDTSAGI